ncbi:NAD-dependent epimerase/dehydratase family protein [Aneurinibacillus uraniidurans]|uniref:NAD-dependent epimerase/dehydratase family protein n=1 Tax=Aneurinibacillus uraniidurans TaxID=2966586 RepID=UPI00234BEBC9|nr:NAD-dependent epimerase/dehydratase family protein [Aneurinibacillus sp. B1]WCN39147.1 NAD-dependent epimerase/dehydratase family protein [Aneurinibacillus sp. B1]
MKPDVLVTGATGFLGQRLARCLHADGYRVTATGRNSIVGEKLAGVGIGFIPADLADSEAVAALCKGKTYVFHSAALSSPWGKYRDFYQANVVGTKNIIAGCQTHDVSRLIHVSTPSVYFAYEDRLNIREDEPLPQRFVNHYAATKFLAEQEVERAVKSGLPAVMIRPRALFGPGDTTILPRLIRANEKKFVPLINGGQALVDVTYVDNVVDALRLAAVAPETALGQVYNITNGEPLRLIDLLTMLFARLEQPFRQKHLSFTAAYRLAWLMEMASRTVLFGREPILTRYSVGVLAKSQTLDISRARVELGYEPRVSIEEGLNLFVDGWRKQHDCNYAHDI